MVAITDKIAASLRVDFDHASDVVYVSSGDPITIVGFVHNGWDQHLATVSEIIGQHLNVDPGAVLSAIMREVKK